MRCDAPSLFYGRLKMYEASHMIIVLHLGYLYVYELALFASPAQGDAPGAETVLPAGPHPTRAHRT